MEIKDLVIALMAFAAFGLVSFSFVSTLYSPDNLGVTIEGEAGTNFNTMYQTMNSTRQSTDNYVGNLQSYAPGGANATIQEKDISTADLLISGLKSLAQIPQSLNIFRTMVTSIASTLGISTIITGFLIGVVVITILIIITTAVLKWNG